MIRFIFAAIFLVVFLVLSIPIFFIEFLIGKFNRNDRDYSCLRIVQWGFRVILKISGVTTTVIGEENIPDEPVLFIGNHRSFFDIPLTYIHCKRLTGYISKDGVQKVPLLSTWMNYLYCLFLNRDNPKEGLKTILQAIDHIKHGISICIFPEGTRNKGTDPLLLPFKEGAFKISTKTGCPIILMTMNHTSEIFEDHLPFIRKTHVILEYSAPIYPDQLTPAEKKHIGSYCHKIMLETLQKNAEL